VLFYEVNCIWLLVVQFNLGGASNPFFQIYLNYILLMLNLIVI